MMGTLAPSSLINFQALVVTVEALRWGQMAITTGGQESRTGPG